MFQKCIGCCIFLLAFYCLASVSPSLLDAGDFRVTWAHVGIGGAGGACGTEQRRGVWGAASGRQPRVGRSGASRSVI
jgi:hypothetical protein